MVKMQKAGEDVSFFDLLDPNAPRAAKELAMERYDVCKDCPFFLRGSKRCSQCGCFMALKTTLELAKCPKGYWHR